MKIKDGNTYVVEVPDYLSNSVKQNMYCELDRLTSHLRDVHFVILDGGRTIKKQEEEYIIGEICDVKLEPIDVPEPDGEELIRSFFSNLSPCPDASVPLPGTPNWYR